jgi:hypothetical protein
MSVVTRIARWSLGWASVRECPPPQSAGAEILPGRVNVDSRLCSTNVVAAACWHTRFYGCRSSWLSRWVHRRGSWSFSSCYSFLEMRPGGGRRSRTDGGADVRLRDEAFVCASVRECPPTSYVSGRRRESRLVDHALNEVSVTVVGSVRANRTPHARPKARPGVRNG